MYLKRKKFRFSILVIFLIFISAFFVVLNTNKKLIQKELFYFVDILDSKLYKITTFAELFNHNNIYLMGETYSEIIKTAFINFPSFLNKISLYYKSNEYEFKKINLNFKFNNYKKLLEDRLESVKSNIGVSDRNEVKGSLKYNDKVYKINSSIKGKLIDHFRSPSRFSLKINMKDNQYLFGMREFSIQKPESRASPYEQIFLEIVKNLGFVVPKHMFLQVNFNDKNWGVMNIEENPSKETLELQQFTGELIFQFGNEKNKFLEKQFSSNSPMDSIINLETFPIRFLDSKRVHKNKFFINNLVNHKFNKKIYQYFDHEKMCSLALLSIIWGSSHVLELNNTQYAYNIYSRKISPIPQDVAATPRKINNKKDIAQITRLYLNSCSKIKNKNILLKKIELAVKKSQAKIKYLQQQFPVNNKIDVNVLYQNINFLLQNMDDSLILIDDRFPISKIQYDKNILDRLDIFNIKLLRKHNFFYVYIGNQIKSDVHINNLTLTNSKRNNLINKKIKVNKKIRGIYFKNFKEYLDKKKDIKLTIPIDSSMVNSQINQILFDVIIDKINFKFEVTEKFPQFNYDKNNYENHSFDFLKKIDDNTVLWKKGNWNVTKPINIRDDLIIQEGTKINFTNQSYLYLEGILKILGNKNDKVIISSSDSSWKGFHINSNDKKNPSIIYNAEFSELNSYEDDAFKMNGGINFYNSDVKINNLIISNVYSEDAINLINTSFSIENLHVDNTGSDALDSDFSKGVIKNSSFKNITGDAIDTSGSNVIIKDTLFYDILDKAISAGEKSNIKLSNLSFNKCLICIVAKDDSKIDVYNFVVKNYSLYFAAAYKKKNFYKNGGELNFLNSSQDDLNFLKIVRDNQSKIFLKNVKLDTEINDNFKYFYDYRVFN